MKQTIYALLLAFSILGCAKDELTPSPTIDGIAGISVNSIGNDPFTPYLNSTPRVSSTISTTVSGEITIKRFTFKSRDSVNNVFAILAYPTVAGVYPAILFNHGGGGNAETKRGDVEGFAKLGYVTMTFDIPGIADPNLAANSSGPWKALGYNNAALFNVTGGPRASTLFEGGVAGLEAFNFLRSQPNVDANNVAISGGSWGGYMTTFLSGLLRNKVKAAYSAFGCGYYELGSTWAAYLNGMSAADRATWLTYLDAGRRAPNITAPYFIEEPTNDFAFWPEAVTATLNVVPGVKNHCVMPNLNHAWFPQAATMKQLYMDYYLKGTGTTFGSTAISNVTTLADSSLQITLTTTMPAGIAVSDVRVYYSVPTSNWQNRVWEFITAPSISANVYRTTIPAALAKQKINYFASVTDTRTVTTSTVIYPVGAQALGNGTYRIENRNSGLAIDATGKLTANGTALQQWGYNAGVNQQWTVTAIGNGQYQIIGVQSGRAIDVSGQLTADGTGINLYDYKGTNNQKWIITPVTGTSYWKIQGVQSGKLLEVSGNSTTAGALLDIRTDTNSNNQQWAFRAP